LNNPIQYTVEYWLCFDDEQSKYWADSGSERETDFYRYRYFKSSTCTSYSILHRGGY
jgi:hypothetical protein